MRGVAGLGATKSPLHFQISKWKRLEEVVQGPRPPTCMSGPLQAARPEGKTPSLATTPSARWAGGVAGAAVWIVQEWAAVV